MTSTVTQLYGEPPITRNERTFTCGSRTNCPNGFGFTGGAASAAGMGGGVTIDTQTINSIFSDSSIRILDTSVIRDNIQSVSLGIQNIYKELMAYVLNLESEIERRVYSGEIAKDHNLYRTVTRIAPRLRSAKQEMYTWQKNIVSELRDIIEVVREYETIVTKINVALYASTISSATTFTDGPQYIAKQTLATSKSVNQAIRRLITLDSQIRDQMQMMQLNLNELSSGVLCSSNSPNVFDINEVVDLLQTLNGIESPLNRIENELVQIVNTTPIKFQFDTANMQLIEAIKPLQLNNFHGTMAQQRAQQQFSAGQQQQHIPVPKISKQSEMSIDDYQRQFEDRPATAQSSLHPDNAMDFFLNYVGSGNGVGNDAAGPSGLVPLNDVDVFRKLLDIQQFTVNTKNTRHLLESVADQVNQNFNTSPLYKVLVDKINEIRETNEPDQVIMLLRQQATNTENIYGVRNRIQRIQRFLLDQKLDEEVSDDLNQYDSYISQLIDIHEMTNTQHQQSLNNPEQYEPLTRSMFVEYNLDYEPQLTLSEYALRSLETAYQLHLKQEADFRKNEYAKYRQLFMVRLAELDGRQPPLTQAEHDQARKAIISDLANTRHTIETKSLQLQSDRKRELRTLMQNLVLQQQLERIKQQIPTTTNSAINPVMLQQFGNYMPNQQQQQQPPPGNADDPLNQSVMFMGELYTNAAVAGFDSGAAAAAVVSNDDDDADNGPVVPMEE